MWAIVVKVFELHIPLSLWIAAEKALCTLSSVRKGDTTSPSGVVQLWTRSTLIFASMMWERRRSPTRNIKHSLPLRWHTIALLLNSRVRVLCFGRTIFKKTSPTCLTHTYLSFQWQQRENAMCFRSYRLIVNNSEKVTYSQTVITSFHSEVVSVKIQGLSILGRNF
jgi:hypothetical protein